MSTGQRMVVSSSTKPVWITRFSWRLKCCVMCFGTGVDLLAALENWRRSYFCKVQENKSSSGSPRLILSVVATLQLLLLKAAVLVSVYTPSALELLAAALVQKLNVCTNYMLTYLNNCIKLLVPSKVHSSVLMDSMCIVTSQSVRKQQQRCVVLLQNVLLST